MQVAMLGQSYAQPAGAGPIARFQLQGLGGVYYDKYYGQVVYNKDSEALIAAGAGRPATVGEKIAYYANLVREQGPGVLEAVKDLTGAQKKVVIQRAGAPAWLPWAIAGGVFIVLAGGFMMRKRRRRRA